MAPFPVMIRYSYSEAGESREARFYGLFHDRSDQAVLGRLRELHRRAARIEVVEVRWRGGPADCVSLDGGRECILGHARQGCFWSAGMDSMTMTQDGAADGASLDAAWRPRRHARCGMFKPAHLVLEDAVLDCVLLDLSPGGAQVYLLARAAVPDRATLWLPGGESRAVRRCWQQGSHIGFEAVGDAVPPS